MNQAFLKEVKEIKLSNLVLGLDWQDYFPLDINERESIIVSNQEEVLNFYQLHYKKIYSISETNPFHTFDRSYIKEKYYDVAVDFFAMKDQGEITGVFGGNLIDWSTYYIRNCSILPSYQGGGRYQLMLSRLQETLEKYNIERIEIEVAPSNLGHIHVLNKNKFNVTGSILSERYGSILKFTKFLNKKNELTFLKQFCLGITPQLENTKNNSTEFKSVSKSNEGGI